jgi:DNA excision repair protein ERCC-4
VTRLKNIYLSRGKEFKPYGSFPPGFTLISDTREQLPLFNPRPKGLNVIHKSLKDGDYSILGFEDKFAIERKMQSDFYSYLGQERKKTISKMQRFKDFSYVALVVEDSEDDIYFGNQFTSLTPDQIRAALVSFRIRYGVQVYFNNDRRMIERFVLDHAIKFYQIMREV